MWTGLLGSGLSLLFWLSLISLVVPMDAALTVQLYLGLVVFAGFVLYDTQLIVEKARMGLRDYVWHAMELFVDALGVFVRLLIILARNSRSSNNSNNNNNNGRDNDRRRSRQ
jgi:Bax inhibitor 1